MKVYMCLSVRGFLRNCKFPKDYRGVFKHDDGRSMEPEEARQTLLDELAKGHEVIPMDAGCGNPCSRKGCKGFDFAARMGGCPGCDE